MEREHREPVVELPYLLAHGLHHRERRLPSAGREAEVDVHVGAVLQIGRHVDVGGRLLVEDLASATGREADDREHLAKLAGVALTKLDLASQRIGIRPETPRQGIVDDHERRAVIGADFGVREFPASQHRQPERPEIVVAHHGERRAPGIRRIPADRFDAPALGEGTERDQ